MGDHTNFRSTSVMLASSVRLRRPLSRVAVLLLLLQFLCKTTVTAITSDGGSHSNGPPLDVRKQWNLISFNLPWDYPANDKEFHDPEAIVATGLAVDYDRIFIATPRLFSGVPSTLSVVPRQGAGDSPVLQAYPNWSFHTAGTKQYNCSELGLVSVYRIRIDSCNRLWALDAGVSRSLEDYEITCPPKILVIDTQTDQVVRRIDFPREVVRGETLFTNLVIDETSSRPENHCDDVFIYISDTVEPAIVVYDSSKDLTWRLSHPSMYPDPNFAQSNILGQRFTLMDGIVGLAFDAKTSIVYFQPLATDRLFSVHTSALRSGPLSFGTELPVKLVGKKSSQGIGLAVSPSDGSIFFSPMSETAVAKWNPAANYQKVLAFDTEQLQFVADIRTTPRDPGAIYVLSSRFHRYFLKNLNANEVNVRIMRLEEIAHDELPHLSTNALQSQASATYAPTTINFKHQHQFTLGSPASSPLRSTPPALQYTSNAVPFFHNQRPQPTPYRFEQVGQINKAVQNPFVALNTGERPDGGVGGGQTFNKLRRGKYSHDFESQPAAPYLYQYNSHPATSFQDFNGLRIAKNVHSVRYNSSVVH